MSHFYKLCCWAAFVCLFLRCSVCCEDAFPKSPYPLLKGSYEGEYLFQATDAFTERGRLMGTVDSLGVLMMSLTGDTLKSLSGSIFSDGSFEGTMSSTTGFRDTTAFSDGLVQGIQLGDTLLFTTANQDTLLTTITKQ